MSCKAERNSCFGHPPCVCLCLVQIQSDQLSDYQEALLLTQQLKLYKYGTMGSKRLLKLDCLTPADGKLQTCLLPKPHQMNIFALSSDFTADSMVWPSGRVLGEG